MKFIFAAFLAFLVYLAISSVTFQVRNPTANEATEIVHIIDVLSFKKLPQFQGCPK